jgi:hypothetical protein
MPQSQAKAAIGKGGKPKAGKITRKVRQRSHALFFPYR